MTLLSVEPSHSFVICEVGSNTPGEIAALAKLVEPEVAVIRRSRNATWRNWAAWRRISQEKLSLLRYLKAGGAAVVNFDSELLRWNVERDRDYRKLKRVSFGQWPEADSRLTGVRAVGVEGEGRDGGTRVGGYGDEEEQGRRKTREPGDRGKCMRVCVYG